MCFKTPTGNEHQSFSKFRNTFWFSTLSSKRMPVSDLKHVGFYKSWNMLRNTCPLGLHFSTLSKTLEALSRTNLESRFSLDDAFSQASMRTPWRCLSNLSRSVSTFFLEPSRRSLKPMFTPFFNPFSSILDVLSRCSIGISTCPKWDSEVPESGLDMLKWDSDVAESGLGHAAKISFQHV